MPNATPLPRRGLLRAGLAASAAVLATSATASATAASTTTVPGSQLPGATRELRALERKYGARLGVYARNMSTGQAVSHRAQERFAMCSTFKAFAAAAVLRDHGHCAPLDKVIHYPPADILPYSPITERHVDTGMTVGDLCAAAIQHSDNAAGNLLLRQLGGPPGLTRFFRSLGDPASRLDRWEPELNTAIPGDLRDTTTPEAYGNGFARLTVGRALNDAQRDRFIAWLKGNTTGDERIRAGVPDGWVVADKTGTGDYGVANDIGVAWTTKRTPLVLIVLSSKTTQDAPTNNALIADAARVLARTLAPGE
ncbi:class A beta-lactamase [Streptomyces sp. NPDC090442]|uniref:class A beta-lactamase n=1 Tax=Streptomyces sp. NPDC090442 TaxID=3365962 RepID=UPI00382F74E5